MSAPYKGVHYVRQTWGTPDEYYGMQACMCGSLHLGPLTRALDKGLITFDKTLVTCPTCLTTLNAENAK